MRVVSQLIAALAVRHIVRVGLISAAALTAEIVFVLWDIQSPRWAACDNMRAVPGSTAALGPIANVRDELGLRPLLWLQVKMLLMQVI